MAKLPIEMLGTLIFFRVVVAAFERFTAPIFERLAEAKRHREESRRHAWEASGRSLGLEPAGDRRFRGEIEGFHVETWTEPGSTAAGLPQSVQLVRLESGGAWPTSFRLAEPAGFITSTTRDLVALDDHDEAVDLAVLDAPTSAALQAWRDAERDASPRAGVFAAGGELLLVVPQRAPDLRARMERMAGVARALDRQGRSVARCLADGLATADADGRVARLRLLATRFAREAGVTEACAGRLDDPDPRGRLWAARGVGAPGLPVLHALAVNGGIPEAVRLEALADWTKSAAMTTASADSVVPLLSESSAELRTAGLDAVRRLAGKPSAEILSRLAESATGDEAVALARLVGEGRRSDAEPVLLRLLERDERAVTEEVLRSLQDCGTPACISALLPLTRGAFGAPETKLLARAALQAVRGRMGDVGAGRLDLAEAEDAGGLALPDAGGGGELSGLPGEAGSLAPEDSIN